MIKIVLHTAVQRYVNTRKRYIGMRHDWLIQSRVINTRNRVQQLAMIVDQLLFRRFPRRLTSVVDWLPIFRVAELGWIAVQSTEARAFPRSDVHGQLPDRVRAGNRMRRSLLRCNSIQQRKH